MKIQAKREPRPFGAMERKNRAAFPGAHTCPRSLQLGPCRLSGTLPPTPLSTTGCAFQPRVPDVSTLFPLSIFPSPNPRHIETSIREANDNLSPHFASHRSFQARISALSTHYRFTPPPRKNSLFLHLRVSTSSSEPAAIRRRKYLICPFLPLSARYQNAPHLGLRCPGHPAKVGGNQNLCLFMRMSIVTSLVIFCALLTIPGETSGAGRQLTGVYAPAATPALPPEEAAKKFAVPDGFEVRIFAAEPDVVNPVGMTWDERGRLWVVELYEYPLGAAPGTKPRDNVKILEDTDNDGRADKVTVFADGLNLATGVLVGHGGVFVGQAPHLYFMEDTDGDDKADKKTIVATGFGLEDRHELLNGFTWGPDGQLYMTHGVFTHSNVKNPDDPNDDGVIMTAAVARFDPRTKKFEVFAEGTSNPWGVDFDAKGNAFVSACVIDHLFHMAPGGLYTRQAGNPPYPYAYGLLSSIVDHKHFRAAYAGIQVYQGDQYPEEYRGTIFMGNIHDSSIHQDRLTPNGSSFKASFIKDFLRANDGWFRPVSTQVGPDGALWVMDWYDKYPCYQNANADPEGVDRAHGRIWRVVYTGNEKGKPVPSHPEGMDLKQLSTRELVETLQHGNVWHRRVAQRLLSEKRASEAKPLLASVLQEGSSLDARLAALWTLHSAGMIDDAILNGAAQNQEPAIRMWAARITGELGEPSQVALGRLGVLAQDKDPGVLLAVATAVRQFTSGSLTVNTPPRKPAPETVSQVLSLLVLNQAASSDPVIPFLTWMAAEPEIARNPLPALGWLSENGMKNPGMAAEIIRKSMRRICDTSEQEKLHAAMLFLEHTPPQAEPLLIAALDGLIEGQRGKAFAPSAQSTVLARLGEHPNKEIVQRAQQLGTIWGDAAALQASLQNVADSNRGADERVQAIRAVKQQKLPAVREALVQVLDGDAPEPVVNEALLALAEIGGDDTGDTILRHWAGFRPGSRRIAAQALSSRRRWAVPFLGAIEKGTINLSEISSTVVRSLVQSKDDYVRNRAESVIGKFRESDADKVKLIAEKKRVVLNGPVDLKRGYEAARQTCFTCHKLHGEGAEVGPDLTGVGRSSLDALLANVIDPNQIIGIGYENVEVETKDGRIVSGRLVENTDTRVKLLAIGPKEEIVAKDEIESMRVSQVSVMPEGLEQMPDEDFRNMIWYLLNPPQDEKPIYLERKDEALVVRAQVPGRDDEVELVTGVLDPELRPYLHPVKSPSGKVVLTQDRPSDHVWQHGVFTGLHKVNGIDFWTEREGKQRFAALLDIFQEQDHAGWRSLAEWVAPGGEVVLEEEQLVKVYASSTPGEYNIDFDWTLRAKEKPVKIGQHEYGGLSVRMEYHPEHTHLNSDGDTGKATAEQRAAWTAVSRPFGPDQFGIVVYDHPGNPGYPAKWRVDGQGLINPSPSLQGDWSIGPNQERTYHYRLTVHQGELARERFEPVFKTYSALNFETIAGLAQDGESVALWNPEWKVVAPEFEHSPSKLPEYHGRRNVLLTHPYDREKGASLERIVEVPSNKKTVLQVNVASHDQGNWELRIYAGEKLLKKQVVDRAGDRWKTVTVDLTPFAGKKVPLKLENGANDWNWEFGYWNDLRVVSSELQQAAK